jgi:phosphoketolase
VENRFDAESAQRLIRDGAAHLIGDPAKAEVQLIALGAYQLDEAIKAQQHLAELDRCACVTVILEPGRLRIPRDAMEAEFVDDDATVNALFPPGLPRVILTHTRPEPMLGILRRIDSGPARTHALGYISRGGTFDVAGMLFANRCTWAHAVDAAATVAGWNREALLDHAQRAALDGTGKPGDLLSP